jgi:hypothetical protein
MIRSYLILVAGLCALAVPVAGQTHWESYKARSATAVPDQHLTDPALVGAVDLHAHSDPDSYARTSDGFEAAKVAREHGMRAILLKNHWTETAGLAYLVRKYATPGFEVFGGVSLDTPVGGINPQAIRYMVDVVGHLGRIVWMPTHDAEQEVKASKENRPFVAVSRDGRLLPEVLEVIALIAANKLTLATGHVTPKEALLIMAEAKKQGVPHLIVTHPLLGGDNAMSPGQLLEAANLGGFIEIVTSNVMREGETKTRTVAAIRSVGPNRSFVSSDTGLLGSANHPDSLAQAAKALRQAGFTESELNAMFKENPARLIGLPVN